MSFHAASLEQPLGIAVAGIGVLVVDDSDTFTRLMPTDQAVAAGAEALCWAVAMRSTLMVQPHWICKSVV